VYKSNSENPFGSTMQDSPSPVPKKITARVAPYTFKYSFSRFEAAQKNLTPINEALATRVATKLQSFLNSTVTVEFVKTEKMSVKKYLLTFNDPTFIASLDIQPINSHGLLEVNSILIYSIVNKMLGGEGDTPIFAGQLQKLELAFARKFFNIMLAEVGLAWKSKQALDFTCHEIYTSPASVYNMQSHEIVFISTFKMCIGSAEGLFTMALPALSLIPMVDEEPESAPATITTKLPLDNLDVTLTAVLGQCELSYTDVKGLLPGDILAIPQESPHPVDIKINGETKFRGTPGLVGKFKGVILQKAHSKMTEEDKWTI
jgi:flagellar motor switch protein FliM